MRKGVGEREEAEERRKSGENEAGNRLTWRRDKVEVWEGQAGI